MTTAPARPDWPAAFAGLRRAKALRRPVCFWFRGWVMQKARFDQPLRKLRHAREELRHEYSRIRHDLVRLDKMIAQRESMNEGSASSPTYPAVIDTLQDVSAKDI